MVLVTLIRELTTFSPASRGRDEVEMKQFGRPLVVALWAEGHLPEQHRLLSNTCGNPNAIAELSSPRFRVSPPTQQTAFFMVSFRSLIHIAWLSE